MATAAYFDKLRTIYNFTMRDKLVNQIQQSSPLFDRLMSNAEFDGGAGVEVPLDYAYNYNIFTTTPYGRKDFVVPSGPAVGVAEFHPMTQMVGYSKLDMKRSQGTEPNKRAVKYLAHKINQAQITLRYYMGLTIFGDGSSFIVSDTEFQIDPVEGLRKIIATSNTVHGISQTTYPWWQAGSVATGTTTVADFKNSSNASYVQTLIGTMLSECTVNGVGPDLIVTTKVILRLLKETMGSNERFVNLDDNASIGWNAIMFENVPVVADELCPDGYIFGLTTSHLRIAGNEELWFEMSEFDKQGDGYVADLDVDWALVCDSPRHQGVISGCPTTYS